MTINIAGSLLATCTYSCAEVSLLATCTYSCVGAQEQIQKDTNLNELLFVFFYLQVSSC